MLGSRILTALILIPVAVAALLWLPQSGLALVFGAVALLAAWEWGALVAGPSGRGLFVALTAAGLLTLWYLPLYGETLIWAAVAGWLIAIALVLAFDRVRPLFALPLFVALSGLLILWSAWVALLQIHLLPNGALWLLWLFALIWAADIGAYFSGRRFGRHRLAPAVSPGKTWEGAIGGLLLSLGVSLAGLAWLDQLTGVLIVSIPLLVVVSIFGDLFESALKRAGGVKDSGTLLPGHGGVLDRIDSLLAVLPIAAMLLSAQP